MKKIIGIFVITVIIVTAFFNTNTNISNDNNLDIAKLIAINTANAERIVTIVDCDEADPLDLCSYNNNFPGCDNSWFWDDCTITLID